MRILQSFTGPRVLLGGVLLVALVVRIVAAVWWEERLAGRLRFGFPDSESYWTLGQRLARGEAYEFGPDRFQVFRTPGYPLLLAGLFRLLGNDDPPTLVARCLGAVCGTLAVGGVMGLTRMLFDRRAALVAGLIAAVYPGAIALSVFLLSEALFCPLMIGHLGLWTAAWRADRLGRRLGLAFVGGLLAGAATLVRPSWLLFVPFAATIGMLRSDRRQQLPIDVAMLCGLCVAMLPWWWRNYRVTGQVVLTTLQVGASLYDGWNPDATGASDMRFLARFEAEQRAEDELQQHPLDGFETRLDRRMCDAAVAWAREHPGKVMRLAGVKVLRTWNPWPNAEEFGSRRLRWLVAAAFLPAIAASVGATMRFVRRDWPYLLCTLPAIYFTGLHAIFVGSIRYREPVMLALLALAGGLISKWRRHLY